MTVNGLKLNISRRLFSKVMGKLNVITGNPQLAQCSLCLLCLLSVILISCFSMLIINMTKDPSNKISALASYASV